jgi:RND family efflux transporter MFP subunit
MTFENSTKWLIGGAILIGAGALITTKVYLPKATPAPVVVQTSSFMNTINGIGTLEAKEVVVLAPKTTSKIQFLYADEGDVIRQGQVLAKMEISELRGNLQESSASIAKSRSQLASQKAIIDDLEAKKSLADITLSRYKTLLGGGFVTQAEFDTAQAGVRSATAQLTSAKENLKQSEHEIEKSQAIRMGQEEKIDDLTLRSPFNGIVISREAEVGSTVGGGVAVFRLADPKTVWVKIYIDERQSGALKVGQNATVILRSSPDTKLSGKVRRIGMESDRTTEERVVYIVLDSVPLSLHFGEQAEAQITIESKAKTDVRPQL